MLKTALTPSSLRRALRVALLATLFATGPARAEPVELTRGALVELLQQAPRARVAEAEAQRAKASAEAAGALSLENPTLSALGGLRLNPDGSKPFAGQATLAWPVELGGKRDDRRAAARAEEAETRGESAATKQRLLLGALLEHAAALRDQAELGIAESRRDNSERVLASAERRRAAGSVTPLDVSLATLQRGRDAAAVESARGERDAAVARLQAALGLPAAAEPRVVGTLVPEDEPPPLDALLLRVDERAEVRAARDQLTAAHARARREHSAAAPTVSVLAQYERDDGANIASLGLSIPLPLLNTNRQARASASGETSVAEARLAAVRASAIGELKALYARYEATRRARATLAPTAQAAKEAIALAVRTYELGEGDLASVLLVQREALEAERVLLETEYAHAAAKLELLVALGRVPR